MDEKPDRLRSKVSRRFTTTKQINKFKRLQQLGLKNVKNSATINNDDQEKKTSQNLPVEGNRIVNLNYLSEQMVCSSCGKDLLLKNIVKEQRLSLGSHFEVKCTCGSIKKVISSEKYSNPASGKKVFAINTKMALGNFFLFFFLFSALTYIFLL